MDFTSSDPSAVRSIKQREFLNAWLRASHGHLPFLGDFRPERVTEELVDMMGFDVVREGARARFLITHEGARLTATYGNDHVDPARRTNRFLDDAIGPERYANVVAMYHACVTHRRPAYSISTVEDADGKSVSYERLLLPFGGKDTVEQIVGSYKSISIEGGFKISNLMGLKPEAVPVIQVRAIIDRDFLATQAGAPSCDEIVELD
jgi:hypothetical protein